MSKEFNPFAPGILVAVIALFFGLGMCGYGLVDILRSISKVGEYKDYLLSSGIASIVSGVGILLGSMVSIAVFDIAKSLRTR